jgi:glycosyltransferase involved in cell wall biosynthesis
MGGLSAGAGRPGALKVLLAHDWLNGMRGGEKCLEVLCELYPGSPVYTLFHEPGKVSRTISEHPIRVSPVQRVPGVYSHYRWLLPLFPAAMESLRPEDADVLVSTSHCVAKGMPKGRAVHVCYCFTPMRYAWSQFEGYFGDKDPVSKFVFRALLDRLQAWDRRSSTRVDRFVAISKHVQSRIREFYGRESEVIYPPADTAFYFPDASVPREDYYLVVSALVPYKRVDHAVRAAALVGRRLVVIGSGPELERLKAIPGARAEFLGWQSDEAIRAHYRKARALLFPGEEDFGIVPVEAQACGLPVIALGRGGALETVIGGRTGLFYDDDSPAGLAEAIRRFESRAWDAAEARRNAERFDKERFRREIDACVRSAAGTGAS